MSESERLWAEIRAMADRVAKLEADREELRKRCDALSDAVGRLEHDALDPEDQS